MIDNQSEKLYTKQQLAEAIANALSFLNLDNGIDKCAEGANDMPSSYREIYYYAEGSEIKTVRINGKDKRDADEKFKKFLLKKGNKVSVTLKDFIDNTYRESFISNLAETTKCTYEYYISHYIVPFLGDMDMDKITLGTIQQFYDWLANGSKNGFKQDINCKTIERVGNLCSRMFKVAVEMKIVDESPFKMKLIHNNGKPAGHHVALPDKCVSNVKQMIPTIIDERDRLYMGLIAYTGMRREEVLGLTWDRVNLDDGYGEVKTVVVYPNKSHCVIKENPKTEKSERIFVIPTALKDILLPCKRDSGFVIHGNTSNTPISYSTLQRMCKRVFGFLGITGYNNHDWRATYATQLKESGLTSAQVADLMGHADTRMVETVYARTRPEGVLKHKNAVENLG